jgi:hypothetical protein
MAPLPFSHNDICTTFHSYISCVLVVIVIRILSFSAWAKIHPDREKNDSQGGRKTRKKNKRWCKKPPIYSAKTTSKQTGITPIKRHALNPECPQNTQKHDIIYPTQKPNISRTKYIKYPPRGDKPIPTK